MQTHFPVEFNLYLWLILGLLFFTFFLDLVANALNASILNDTLPAEFQGIYDQEKYRTAIHYQQAGFRFETLRKCISFAVTVGFILFGGFNAVDGFARGFGWGEIPTGLVFVAALLILRFFLNLPFSIYDTFVLEEKFGFNRTTPKTFVADMLKGTVLGALIGGPIFALIVWFFGSTGTLGWFYSWAAFTFIQLGLSFLAPAVIMPLFNKFDPLPDGELKAEIERFAQKQSFSLQGIFKMDSSKRSTKSNAFFTGFGRFRRLVLFDTLIERQTISELVAVLAHEIGHFKRKHIIKGICLSIAVTAVLFYGLGFFLNNEALFAAFGMASLSVYASLVFSIFLFSPAMRLLGILTNLLSRKHEFEADSYAVETYGRSEELVSALKKLSIDNLSNLTPHPLKIWLDYTHPPILERIEHIRKISASGA